MKLITIEDDALADFICDFLKEASINKYEGIRNCMILALSNDGTPFTCTMDATDGNAIGAMFFHAQSHMFAREMLKNRAYYEEMFFDFDEDDDDEDCEEGE